MPEWPALAFVRFCPINTSETKVVESSKILQNSDATPPGVVHGETESCNTLEKGPLTEGPFPAFCKTRRHGQRDSQDKTSRASVTATAARGGSRSRPGVARRKECPGVLAGPRGGKVLRARLVHRRWKHNVCVHDTQEKSPIPHGTCTTACKCRQPTTFR